MKNKANIQADYQKKELYQIWAFFVFYMVCIGFESNFHQYLGLFLILIYGVENHK